jgi:hypothetical protein
VAFFGARNTLGVTLTLQVKALLTKLNLTNKIITYVKDERGNLSTLVVTLIFVVNCVPLQIDTPYLRICFKHVMSKACQYATNHDHVCLRTKEVNLKGAQFNFQNTIT